MIFTCHYESPLGGITLASDGTALTGLWFDGQKYFGSTLTGTRGEPAICGEPEICEKKDLPVFVETSRWLTIYFQGGNPDFTPALSLRSTPFRMKIWKILLAIPYGTTLTYGEIAAQIAKDRGLSGMSAQAVGGAVGHNPISIIVPCHRVLGSGGKLTGYAGGIDKKIRLLELEGIDTSRLSV